MLVVVAPRRDGGHDAADDERHEHTPEERGREVGADEHRKDEHQDEQSDQGHDATGPPGGSRDTTDTAGLKLADAALVILGGVVQRLDRSAVVGRQPVRSVVGRLVGPRSRGCGGGGSRCRCGRRARGCGGADRCRCGVGKQGVALHRQGEVALSSRLGSCSVSLVLGVQVRGRDGAGHGVSPWLSGPDGPQLCEWRASGQICCPEY